MRTLQSLRREAAQGTNFRGHRMRWSLYHGEGRSLYNGTCTRCGGWVQCNTNPLPNGIDIGGSAVALTCPISLGHIGGT
jgi:hypothetical protein